VNREWIIYEVAVSPAYGPARGRSVCEAHFDTLEVARRKWLEEIEKALGGWNYGIDSTVLVTLMGRSGSSAQTYGRAEVVP
jgi:hypothetical protein